MKKNLPEPQRTMFSANFTANKLMGRKQVLENLERNAIDYTQKEAIKEELTTFLNNGGEGIDLTFEEACMIHGIANIFTKYDYPDYIECTEEEINKAMRYNKNLSGWQRQKSRKILENLSNKKFPIYWFEDNRWRMITFDTLIKLAWGVRSKDGNVEFKTLPTRQNFDRYRIQLEVKLFGNMNKNFRLADPNIGKEIREYRKSRGQRPSKYDIRLYDLLLGESKKVIKRNYLKLAQAPMLMDHYIRERKIMFTREKLNSIYKMYYELGYLSNFLIDQPGAKYSIDILFLNPERFYKLRG